MENIIYLEEELPEIIISEYVSQNEYIKENNKIGVNVHPENELIDQISILIKSLKDIQIASKRKAEAFLDIHKMLSNENILNFPNLLYLKCSLNVS